jgi:uncharacterized lipoprotein YajG
MAWLLLTGCQRESSVLSATATNTPPTQVSIIPSAVTTPVLVPSPTNREPKPVSTTDTPSITTPTAEPQPMIVYTPWELVHDLAW